MPESDASNVFLVTGTDTAMISAEAGKLAAHAAGENADAFSLDIIRERDGVSPAETVNEAIRSALSPPFLGNRKTVWLQGFSRFDAEGTKDSRTAEATALRELSRIIKEGIPSDIVLIMSGPGVDMRRGLATACKATGNVVVCKKPELRDRNWERDMRGLIEGRAADKQVTLPRDVVAYLVDVVGTDTGRIDSELEKLICYCGGPDAAITVVAAQQVCTGQGEAVSWALSNAVGDRNLQAALEAVDVLLRQGKSPDSAAHGLLLQTVGLVRQLLQIRVFMQGRRLRTPQQTRSAAEKLTAEERRDCQQDGLEFVRFHPYRVQALARQALQYSGKELIEAFRVLRDANLRCVSSSVSTRVVLEDVLIRLIGRPARTGPEAMLQRRRGA